MKTVAAIHKAIQEGDLKLCDQEVPCAVLEDGSRMLSCPAFMHVIGRPWRKKYREIQFPGFLSVQNLRPFMDEKLSSHFKPVDFRSARGGLRSGYPAELLPKVCEAYVRASLAGVLKKDQLETADACNRIMTTLNSTGINALVDQATGYDKIRDREQLNEYLGLYFTPELAVWAQKLPDVFYQELFRLRGWVWEGMGVSRPRLVGKYTHDIVFSRLGSKLVDELSELQPQNLGNRHQHTRHPWISDSVGHPGLENHVFAAVGLMRASPNWARFYRMLQRSFPKKPTSVKIARTD